MKYFESFPSILYTFDKNTENLQSVTNIFARSAFLRDIKGNVDVSYEYLVKDSDTPESIAFKEYGDAYRSWILLLFNNIMNPNYDWPLKSDSLDDYIEAKYGQSVDEAKNTINHYEKVVTNTQYSNGMIVYREVKKTEIGEYDINFSNNTITPNTLPTVPDTSLTITEETVNYTDYILNVLTEIRAVSNYQTEFNANEEKRKIRILAPSYIQRVETEFRELMRNG